MFDWVETPEIKCDCGKVVDGWQSKDGDCLLETVSWKDVDTFYAVCKHCNAWLEYRRRKVRENELERDFVRTVETLERRREK